MLDWRRAGASLPAQYQGAVLHSGNTGIDGGNMLRLRRHWLLLALLWLLAVPVAWAAPATRHYTLSGWTMEDGLPHPLVHVVAQDRDGFLWVGTWEGVVRFNGRGFSLFDRQNVRGMELAGVYSILPEADGGVLFGTARNGIVRYYQGDWQRVGGEAARMLAASALWRGRDGALWFASGRRLLRLDGHGLQDAGRMAGLPAGEVLALAEDKDGALLVAGEAGLHRITQGRAQRWGADWVAPGAATALLADGRGGWLAAHDGGVRWRHADGRIERIDVGRRVSAMVLDERGVLWMNLSDGQLLRRDADGSQSPMGIPGTVNKALLLDREGLVWVGSSDGLYRVADGQASGLTRRDGLASDYVRSVLQDEQGAYWIGHADGLSRWSQGRMQTIRLGEGAGAHDTSVLSLAQRDGKLWVGTYDLGVLQLDAQGRVLQRLRLGSGTQPVVRALLPEPDGSLWIGGNHGLVHWRDGRAHPYLGGAGQPDLVVQALYRDPNGPLWIGTNNGMAMLDAGGRLRRWEPEHDVPAQYFFDFLRDGRGDLWIASDRGLLRMRDGRFTVYDHARGLPRDKLFRIIDDGVGSLWLSSNTGVFRVARRELDEIDAGTRTQLAVHVLDRSDGMPGSQSNGASQPAGWLTREGRLLFPTSAGLAVIEPRALVTGRVGAPPVAFERIIVDGQAQPLRPLLTLQPRANRLAIGYAGMSFRALDKLRYRYRLHGYDQDWVSASADSEAVYTRLPPGSYQLEVQAMAMPVDWSRSERIGSARMDITVVPALWQRPWVRALLALGVVAVVALLGWWRTASLRRRQRQLNRVIAERTEELSEKNRQLEVAGYRLQHLATHDGLTGLPNRRAGDAQLVGAVAQARAEARPLSVALIDIDHFKQINDRYGHAAGDAVLQAVGGVLAEFVAEWGLFAARFGGEEFMVCMEELPLVDGATRMRELLERIRTLSVTTEEGAELHCTFSAGVAELVAGQTPHALLALADDRLLQAKQQGRNRIVAG